MAAKPKLKDSAGQVIGHCLMTRRFSAGTSDGSSAEPLLQIVADLCFRSSRQAIHHFGITCGFWILVVLHLYCLTEVNLSLLQQPSTADSPENVDLHIRYDPIHILGKESGQSSKACGSDLDPDGCRLDVAPVNSMVTSLVSLAR